MRKEDTRSANRKAFGMKDTEFPGIPVGGNATTTARERRYHSVVTRVPSGGSGRSPRREREFPAEGTSVSMRGNECVLRKKPMCPTAVHKSLMLILALLFLGANWNEAWGQNYNPGEPSEETVMQILRNIDGAKELVDLIDNNSISYDSYNDEKGSYEVSSGTWVIDRVWSPNKGSFWPDNVNIGNVVQSGISIQNQNSTIDGNAEKIIYAKPGDVKELAIQAGDGAESLDGFLHWYITTDLESENKTRENLDWSGQDNSIGKALKFDNGLAWLRGSQGRSYKLCLRYHYPSGWVNGYWKADLSYTGWQERGDETATSAVSKVHYTVPSTASKGDIIYVVCEASARNNATGNGSTVFAPKISLKSVFEIHVLDSDDDRFGDTAKKPFTQSGWTINLSSDAIAHPENYFLEHFEIHTPVRTGTNYRLSEPLGNYYVPDQEGEYCWVQWRMFDSEGEPVNGTYNNTRTSVVTEQDKNILKYTFPYTNEDQQYIYYVTASIGYSSADRWGNVNQPDTWYPVSFMKVYLEPFTRPLTAQQLKDYEDAGYENYQFRYDSYLQANGYEEVYAIPFEDASDRISPQSISIENNARAKIIENMRSSYAFVDLGIGEGNGFQYRKNDRLSAGRGEFGLYRTLNYPDISDGTFQIGDLKGTYNDWFASNGYDVEVVDRTWEKTEGQQSGYFMYLDATDEPGIITKIDITNLCPHTTLLVSAWICDLAESTSAEHADVDFTLKRIIGEGDNETEETLVKFYSGIVTNQPTHTQIEDMTNPRAKWQQVAFQFTFDEGTYDDRYVLEIANNTPRSVGADYAIDDIMVYKSSPRIDVERMDACDARTLTVNTNYETVLSNMGWTAGENVPASEDRPTEYQYAKYGYGLPDDHYGNIYFAFLEGLWEDADGNVITVADPENDVKDVTDLNYAIKNEDIDNLSKEIVPRALPATTSGPYQYRWVRANRNLTESSAQSVYSFRVVVSTNKSDIPQTETVALAYEKRWNFNAVLDYNKDVEAGKVTGGTAIDINADKEIVTSGGLISNNTLTETTITQTQYDEYYQILVEELYSRLQIPRIRCPWFQTVDREERLYLYEMDVAHTDLMYAGEPYLDEEGKQQEASGKYHVMVFSGQQISGYPTPTEVPYSELCGVCSMISSFTVYGSAIIRVDTETDANTLACAGTQRTITSAELINLKTGDPLEGVDYNFDWYLDAPSEYDKLLIADMHLKEALDYFRNNENEIVSSSTVEAWIPSDDKEEEIQTALLGLLDPENPRLVISQKENFRLPIYGDSIVAMPYVTQEINEATRTLYCTEITGVEIPQYSEDVPILHPGYTLEPFKGEVPLRLGHPNMGTNMNLIVPLQKGFSESMAERADRLGIIDEEGVNISLNNIELGYPPIGVATSLNISKGTETTVETPNATITITLNDDAKKYLKEGQQYELLIPFVQYDGEEALSDECWGEIVLPVKIVPEYLTWKGSSSDNWYDESKWNQSTKKDLYFTGWDGTDAEKDANGPDGEGNYEEITDAFSPLYFTKITILGGEELALSEPAKVTENGHSFLPSWAEDGSDSIRYEMAVADAQGNIAPYYINKVSEIYFKPEASIHRQDYLTYEKAWVDFEMEEGKPYWMSAPLQNVYAGDMYAPSSNGRQETELFKDIEYNGINEGGQDLNSRWSPAFYQKAWDKAIAYVSSGTTHNADNATDVAAVKSNWSIEYNDVWVPYSEGKGFYARVEDLPGNSTSALVRLPKADTKYSYETKAANNLSKGENISRTNAYKLWGDTEEATKGNVTVDLSKVDGDNQHFLVGNPYMAYLDMDAFFKRNSVLAKKYWLLENGTSKAVVGTPDVDWKGNETEDATNGGTIDGLIPPMTAFFVELANTSTATQADNTGAETSISITFTPDMMAKRPQSTAETKAASFVATNPTLTITAERGETRSVAKLLTSDKAENGYRASEDAVVLLDSELDAPMVYTVAGSRAAQVNAVKKISNIGLGVYNAVDDEATLTISGLSQMASPLYLYDAATRQSTRLEGDSYELRVSGDSHGRYFLRDAELGDELENTISIYSARSGEVIVSSLRPVKDIRVFALNGSQVRRFSVNTTRYTFTLPAGIYMIQATDGERGQTEKVLVR